MSWNDLTIDQLKRVLIDAEVNFPTANVRKQSLVHLCEKRYPCRIDLLRTLRNYGKLSEAQNRELFSVSFLFLLFLESRDQAALCLLLFRVMPKKSKMQCTSYASICPLR